MSFVVYKRLTYNAACGTCRAEFAYEHSDTLVLDSTFGPPGMGSLRVVLCPICKTVIPALAMVAQEIDYEDDAIRAWSEYWWVGEPDGADEEAEEVAVAHL